MADSSVVSGGGVGNEDDGNEQVQAVFSKKADDGEGSATMTARADGQSYDTEQNVALEGTAGSADVNFGGDESVNGGFGGETAMSIGDTGASDASPAAAAAASLSTPFTRHLGRNRACQSCRERKLKCDGVRPICGQCGRAWAMRRRSYKGKGVSDEELRDMEKPCLYIDVPDRRRSSTKGSGGGGRAAKSTVTAGAGHDGSASGDSSTKPQSSLTPLQEANQERRRLERELAELKARIGLTGNRDVDHPMQPNSDELSIAEVLANTMRAGEGGSGGFPTSFSSEALGGTQSLSSFVEGLAQRANEASTAVAAQQQEQQQQQQQQPAYSEQSASMDTGPIDPLLLNEHSHAGASYDRATTTSTSSGGVPVAGQADPLMELILTGWPSDFPPPAMVDTLVRIFFEGFEHLRFLFHPTRFYERLAQGPASPRYPHPAVLHAMFSLAYVLRPDLDSSPSSRTQIAPLQQEADELLNAHLREKYARARTYADPASQAGHTQGIQLALQSRTDRDRAKLGSAGYHSERAQYHISIGMWEGGDLTSITKAALMLTTKRYGCGEIFDAWMSASISTRLATALAINRSNPTTTTDAQRSGRTPVDTIRMAMVGAPADWVEEEERRRLMFLILATDRSACASTLWASSLDDADVTVELPMLSNIDFTEGNAAALANATRQTLQSPDLFTKHHIDGFNTMIKACILMGRIASFMARLPAFATAEDVMVPAFTKLDNTLTAFAMSLPFRATDPDARGQIDVFRFATYAVMHTNALLLHGPLLRVNGQSAVMCETACQAMLFLLRILIAAGTEPARLPPLLILCLGTMGKVLVRRLQMLRGQVPPPPPVSEEGGESSSVSKGTPSMEMRFDIAMQPAGPFAWTYMPVPKDGQGAAAEAAGMGGAASSEKEEALRGEIDLVFTYLCKMGQTWPMATRQAQSLAQMLGIETAAPEALQQGLFTERNHSGHTYGS